MLQIKDLKMQKRINNGIYRYISHLFSVQITREGINQPIKGKTKPIKKKKKNKSTGII